MSFFVRSIKKHPLAWFYGISVFIVLALIPIFILIGADEAVNRAFEQTGLSFNTDLVTAFRLVGAVPEALPGVLLAVAQVASPDIAVAIVVGLAYGWPGLAALKNRFRFWPREMSWSEALGPWSACLLVFAGMSLATAGLSRFLWPVEGFVWELNLLSVHFLIGFLIAMFLDAGALFEENGWRGFALPLLQGRYGPLPGSLILGLLWAFWHVPVKFDVALNYGLANFGLMFSVLTLKFVLLTIIMTYFWNKVGQTTIIAIVMHGLSNDSARLGGNVLTESFWPQLHYEINLVLPMLGVALLLMVLSRGRMGQPVQNNRVRGEALVGEAQTL